MHQQQDRMIEKLKMACKGARTSAGLAISVGAERIHTDKAGVTHSLILMEMRHYKPTGKSLNFELIEEERSAWIQGISAGDLVSFLAASDIFHHGREPLLTLLDQYLTRSGLLPMDNTTIDIAAKATAISDGYGLDWDVSLRGLGLHAGMSRQAILATSSAEGEALAIAHLMGALIQDGLDQLSSRDSSTIPDPVEIDWVATLSAEDRALLSEPPLPDSGLPKSRKKGPWRQTGWEDDEAIEAALMFRRGMKLEKISARLRRSPTAIRARLILDGVIEPKPQTQASSIML